MLSRRPRTISISLPASSTTPSLPGLVSSLRPIKRLVVQLFDESLLLHRFSYKNKNQHKQAKWWNKLIHVDRIINRTLEELNSLLNQFGTSKDSDEIPTITREQLVEGLLRLPRSLLLVEKSIKVLLDCASILEQLIETRAFLAFSLILVSLIARLHTLSIVLQEELLKLSQVLFSLIDSNHLMESVEPLLKKLPKEFKRFIRIRPDSIPLVSTSTSKEPSPIESGGGDDLGAVIIRRNPVEKRGEGEGTGEKEDRVIPVKRPPPSPMIPIEEDLVSPPPVKKLKKEKKVSLEEAGEGVNSNEGKGKGIDLLDVSLMQPRKLKTTTKEPGELVKKKKVSVKGSEEMVVAKKKKKRKPSGGGDEIDAIFG